MSNERNAPVSEASVAALLRTVAGQEIRRVMVIAAHPDDEIVGAGVVLAALPGLRVVHATDGVPADPRYAEWAGFDNPQAYRRARQMEARRALESLGLPATCLLRMGFEDQQLSRRLVPLTRALAALIDANRPDLLITHPYEGGHPDHDAVSFATHNVYPLLKQRGVPLPGLVEMTSYFSRDGERVVGEFAQADPAPVTLVLGEAGREHKARLYGCFTSQKDLLSRFPLEVERFRWAPHHDFSNPPDVPEILYDRFELGTDSRQWLELSKAATKALTQEPPRRWINRKPAVGTVDFGDLARIEPFSRCFGYDRGTPIDRPFIEAFLRQHRADIHGRVLEVGDATYTHRFGGDRVIQSDVLHVKEGAPGATIIGDLSHAPQIPAATFDCVILTQVLVVIFDLQAAVATIHRILKPGGVVLITTPGITNIDKDEWRNSWMWALTPLSLEKLLARCFPPAEISVSSRGNAFTSMAFLQGLCTEDLDGFPRAEDDPHYPLTVLGRAVKAE